MMKSQRLLTVIAFGLFLVACSSGSVEDSGSDTADFDGGGEMLEESMDDRDMAVEMDEAQELGDSGSRLIGEKVIRTVSQDYETVNFQEATDFIRQTVQRHDAFIEYSYESSYTPSGGASRQYRVVDYTLRVPTEQLNAFLNVLEGMDAYRVSEQMGTEDVTQMYRDTEARIDVLNNKEARLTELLEQAETIEEIIQIENSLSETIAEREQLQSQLDYYDDLIDYTVVRMTITERPRISGDREEGLSFLRRVQEALTDSFFAFYYIVQDIIIFTIYAIPYILVLGLIGLVIWFVTKRIKRRN